MASWGIKKLAIVIGSSVVGVGALTGISVAAVQANNTLDSSSNSHDSLEQSGNGGENSTNQGGNNTKPTSDNNTGGNTDGTIGDDPLAEDHTSRSDTTVDFSNYVDSIKKNLEVFTNDSGADKANRANTFPYKLNLNQIRLADDSELKDNVEVRFSLASTNTVETLNDGKLMVKATLTSKEHREQVKEEVIVLEGFKKASDGLKEFFEKTNGKQTYGMSLKNMVDQKKKDGLLFSVEDLNLKVMLFPPATAPAVVQKRTGEVPAVATAGQRVEVTSLTSFFWEMNKSKHTDIGDYTIEGEVKLETISKEEREQVLFKLVSAKQDNPLRLVKKTKEDPSKTEEALISSITLTNLAATDVTVVPKNSVDNYEKDFLAKANVGDEPKAYLTDKGDKHLDRKLAVNLNTMSTGLPNYLFIKPYSIAKTAGSQEDLKFNFDLVVSFGTGENTKRFSTANLEEAKLLKDVGFGFDIYAKKLTEATDEKSSAAAIKKAAGETKAFEANDHNKLIAKPTMPTDKLMTTKVADLTREDALELTIKKDNGDKAMISGNYLIFAGYSYPKINGQESIDGKTLVTSTVTYLNVTADSAK